MSALLTIITKNKNSAVSVEPLPSGNFEVTVESKKVFDNNVIETARAILTRDELTEYRDAFTKALEG